MTVGQLWYAQQGEAWINLGAITTVATTLSLELQMGTTSTVIADGYKKDWTGRVSNISINGGSRDIKALDTLGINQLAQQGRPEIMTAEFTVILENNSGAEYIGGDAVCTFAGTTTSAGTYTGTFQRFQYGEKTTAATDRQKTAVLLKLTDGVKVQYCLLNNAYMTGRELSLSADGYVEEKWTIKCLAQDYYEEDNF
jgi:hypothetical protein